MTRGEVGILNFLSVGRRGISAKDVLKIMTTNGYEVSDIAARRGPIKAGFPADEAIVVTGNPLEDLDALRTSRPVMKDGMVFKKDGVMTPGNPHGGPANGWRLR
jgi:imidazolonepropionase-like amidohydrolase